MPLFYLRRRDGIGRHSGLKIRSDIHVRVQVPSPVPKLGFRKVKTKNVTKPVRYKRFLVKRSKPRVSL